MKSKYRYSRDTWSNRQAWTWSTKWSRAKANRVLPRECTDHVPSSNNIRDDSTQGHYQMVSTKINYNQSIIFCHLWKCNWRTSNAEEAEVERFYEDLQDLLELTPKKDVLFIMADCNAKVESQKTPGITGKGGLGIRNESGQRLTEFCQENTLVIANTLFQQQKRWLYT